jgi:hypothetical protein
VANQQNKWEGFEPEYALLGGVLKQAVKDAEQTANEGLQVEAWGFLEICAPTVAERLRKQVNYFPDKQAGTETNTGGEDGSMA